MALCHLLWIVLVVAGVAETIMNWIFKIHFMSNPFVMQPFDLVNGIWLLVVTFAVGYVAGWVFAVLANMLHKK